MKLVGLLLLPFFLCANPALDCQKTVHALLVLKDYKQAIVECEKAISTYPEEQKLYELKLQCLGHASEQKNVIDFFSALPFKPTQEILQTLGWSVLQTAMNAMSPVQRRVGLIGAFLTQDAKSVFIYRTGSL